MKTPMLVTAAVICLAALAGCSSSGSHQPGAEASSGKAAVSSALANPTTSADIANLEGQLLTAYQKNFSPLHPIVSMEKAIKVVFPSGDASAIATYAVHQLTPAMAHHNAKGKAARAFWAQEVVNNALKSNPNATLPPGSAAVPGVTNPVPSSPAASSK